MSCQDDSVDHLVKLTKARGDSERTPLSSFYTSMNR
jgi:hypothetical protein